MLCQTHIAWITGKNNGFPILDILGYLKNTQINPKFGKVRQIPPNQVPKLGFVSLFQYPKISKIGNPLFFPVDLILQLKYMPVVMNLARITSSDWKS